ncbi:MAG: DNA glycosylase [Puniceicoccaceae bacterium]
MTVPHPPQTQPDWSDWSAVPLLTPFSATSLHETLCGGQAFRWNLIGSPELPRWEGVWSRWVAQLQLEEGQLRARYLNPQLPQAREALEEYLRATTDFNDLIDPLPWRSDPHLRAAIQAFPGLRLLQQPLEETLLAFLLSSTKAIPQISQLCQSLARDFGQPLPSGFYALPTWQQLAEVPESALRTIGCGFRARYLAGTARFLSSNPGYLAQLSGLPTNQARTALMVLPGVGEKIADCVLLFGLGRYEAFPVDTWVLRILRQTYGLADWTPLQLQTFARLHFGPTAGLAQQFLFSHIRHSARL